MVLCDHKISLKNDPIYSCSYLVPSGVGLVRQHLGSGLFSLFPVDEFHQDTLVLEDVALGLKAMINI